MARGGFPSMTALLGLLAVVGYQNRDKIAEMVRQHSGGGGLAGLGRPGAQMGGPSAGLPAGLGGLLSGLFGGGAAASALGASPTGGGLGGLLGGGLGELDQQFRRNGRGEVVDSWVGTGQNREVKPQDLEAALGPDVLEDLTEATGLSREELLQRLSRELPKAVDQYTPEGRIPQPHEFS